MSSLGSLRFVRCGEDGEEDVPMREAAEAVEGRGERVHWVEASSLKKEKGCIYVMEDFSTQHYKVLEGKCRVIGPSVVLSHLQHGSPLPASTQPVFSMAMHGVIACFTQAGDKEKREKLTQQVKLMGGRVDGHLTKRVTHLIAGQVGSDKYHVARKLRLPVLLPSWVESCWEEGLGGSAAARSATDPAFLSRHGCPPFTGLVITVTGLDENVRQRVKEACQAKGGNYSGELTKGVCTHLLVGSKTSQKFKFAQQWGMRCVSPQWFHDSIDAGYCMPEGDYVVESGGVAKGRSLAKTATRNAESPEWASALAAFKIPDIAGEEFLHGCKIYLCGGLSTDQEDKLTRVLTRGGGVRSSQLSSAVTHVVMGERQAELVETAKQLDTRVKVLTVHWLLDSCTRGEKMAEENYFLLQRDDEKPKDTTENPKKRSTAGNVPVAKRPRLLDDHELEDEDDIMNQYSSAAAPLAGRNGEEEETRPLASGVLSGCGSFCISKLFSRDDYAIASQVVRKSGGTLAPPASARYLLAPLEGAWSGQKGVESQLEEVDGIAVTMIWLQRCIDEGRLLDPASYFLFQPMTMPISSSTLVDCVLAFSQFSDLEREHLIRFSQGLGAVVQDHFARYPAHGLLGTTHLVLKQAEGTKFISAEKWGVPAVTDRWLFECAKSQRLVGVESHLVTCQTSEPTPPQTDAASQHRRQLDQHLPNLEDDRVDDRGREDEVKGQDGGGESEEGGERDGGGGDEAEPPLRGVVVCFNKKLASSSNLLEVALSLGAACCGKLDKTVTHYLYQGKATEAVRDREVKQARERGCHVVSPHWLLQCQHTLSRLPEADFPVTFNPSMALNMLVPLSQVAARQDLVSPAPPSPTSSLTSEHTDNDDDDDGRGGGDDGNLTSDPSEAVRLLHQQLDELKEAPREQSKRRRSRRLQKKEVSSNLPSAGPPVTLAAPRTPGKRRGHHAHHHLGRRGRGRGDPPTDSQVSDSQQLQVTYDDPEGRRERAKILARIEREEELLAQGISPKALKVEGGDATREGEERESVQGGQMKTEELTLELPPLGDEKLSSSAQPKRTSSSSTRSTTTRPNHPPPDVVTSPPPIAVPIVTHPAGNGSDAQPLYDQRSRMTRAHKPKFLLSSLEQREKIDYGALIQELGGEYIDQDYFTPKCSHLVVGKASRTEKYLGACAAGKWVLHKSYLEACRSAKKFVWEEEHEWGAGHTEGGNPLESAPRKWRLLLSKRQAERGKRGDDKTVTRSGEGAFAGWKVLVFAEKAKLPGLKRLLEAGGATVVGSHAPSALKGVTHAFITAGHFPKESLSLQSLVGQGVHCLRPDYIAEFLSKCSSVSIEPFLLSEVKNIPK